MGCPKNPKKFLGIFPHEGPHAWVCNLIEHNVYWSMFLECEICKSQVENRLLDDVDMIRKGFDIVKLREHLGDISGDKIEACRQSEP